jgi:hypothetical protein
VEANAIAVRRVKKEDLKRIAKATGGAIVVTLADMEGAWVCLIFFPFYCFWVLRFVFWVMNVLG